MNAPDEPLAFAEHRGYSTNLLAEIAAQALEPGYVERADAPGRRSRPHRLVVASVMLALGLLLGASAGQTLRSKGAADAERAQLVSQLRAAERRVDGLQAQRRELRREVDDLAANHAPAPDPSLQALEVAAGAVAVKGPGVTIVLDDAPDPTAQNGRVLDADVREAVNGLWEAGAEAIAINGFRITSRTAIRAAGDAITVDYRSLVHPYKIEAIGDPQTLQARFAAGPAGGALTYLTQNYHLRYELAPASSLTLPAGQAAALRHAQKEG